MSLRPYQSDAINRLRAAYQAGRRALLLVAPTGAGKTVMFSAMARNAVARGLRVLVLVHRQELIDQVSRALTGTPHGIIARGDSTRPQALVQIASVQTLVRRLGSVNPDLIIIDEAHHAAADTWQRVLAAYPRAWRLGVTATPERLDGSGLLGLFEEIILGPSVCELQDLGFLCGTRYFAPADMDLSGVRTRAGEFAIGDSERAARKVMGNAVAAYNRICPGARAVAFCCTVEHAELQAAAFGHGWACIHGQLDADARRRMVAAFTAGELRGLTSVDVISEGFDLPAIEAAILLRPTKSLSMHLQQIGRALRPFPGKSAAIIIDHAGNLERHGFAEDARQWTLEGDEERKRKAPPAGRRCPECYFINPTGALVCSDCGHEFERTPILVEEVEVEIVEIERIPNHVQSAIQRLGYKRPLLLRQWRDVAFELGYKPGWAWHRFQSQKSKRAS